METEFKKFIIIIHGETAPVISKPLLPWDFNNWVVYLYSIGADFVTKEVK